MEISRVRRGRGGNTSDGEVKSSGGSNHHPSTGILSKTCFKFQILCLLNLIKITRF